MIRSEIEDKVIDYLDYTGLETKIQGWIDDTRRDISTKYNFNYLYTEATASTSAGSGTYALPNDYLGHATLLLGSKKLIRIQPREFEEIIKIDEGTDNDPTSTDYLFTVNGQDPGEPCYYIDRGMEFDLWPTPDDSYTMTMKYYAQPPSATGDSYEDYIMRFHPEAVIFGTALRGAMYLDDDIKIKIFAPAYSQSIQEMVEREKTTKKTDLKVRMKSYKDFDLDALKRIVKVTT